MADTSTLSWSQVAATGRSKRVLSSPSSRSQHSADLKMTSQDIFTDPEFAQQLLARKAASILQKTVAPGSVLFSFPSNLFSVRTKYYEIIEQQLGNANLRETTLPDPSDIKV